MQRIPLEEEEEPDARARAQSGTGVISLLFSFPNYFIAPGVAVRLSSLRDGLYIALTFLRRCLSLLLLREHSSSVGDLQK